MRKLARDGGPGGWCLRFEWGFPGAGWGPHAWDSAGVDHLRPRLREPTEGGIDASTENTEVVHHSQQGIYMWETMVGWSLKNHKVMLRKRVNWEYIPMSMRPAGRAPVRPARFPHLWRGQKLKTVREGVQTWGGNKEREPTDSSPQIQALCSPRGRERRMWEVRRLKLQIRLDLWLLPWSVHCFIETG